MPYAGIKSRLNGRDNEKVKEEFCQLYLEQNLELKDIAKHFKSQGLDASLQQWKTQITLWGIGKHNRESDMLFAARKANQRKAQLGKETGFKIRGQLKTRRDVDQYFRRKDRTEDMILDLDPGKTPEAIVYFSPLASPLMTTLKLNHPLVEPAHMIWDNDKEQQHIRGGEERGEEEADDDDNTVRADSPEGCMELARTVRPHSFVRSEEGFEYRPMWQKTTPISLLATPRSPDIFYRVEIALSSVDDFYGSMISMGKHAFVHEHTRSKAPMEKLLGDLDACRYHIGMGNVYSAEVLWNSANKRLNSVLDDLNPVFLSRLILGVRYFCARSQNEQRMSAIRSALQSSSQNRKELTSFTSILRVLASSPDFFGLMENLLTRGIDYLDQILPAGNDLWFTTVKDLCGIASMNRNWETALKCAVAMREVVEARTDLSEETFHLKIECSISCAGVYMQVERYKEAFEMLRECELVASQRYGYAYIHHAHYLPSLAELCRRIGHKEGALSALRKSWNWCSKNLALEDPVIVQIARHLQDTENNGPDWVLV